eukprot:SAG31_NODE_1094_length_9945_cov_3.834349_9_plen_77_part_00
MGTQVMRLRVDAALPFFSVASCLSRAHRGPRACELSWTARARSLRISRRARNGRLCNDRLNKLKVTAVYTAVLNLN